MLGLRLRAGFKGPVALFKGRVPLCSTAPGAGLSGCARRLCLVYGLLKGAWFVFDSPVLACSRPVLGLCSTAPVLCPSSVLGLLGLCPCVRQPLCLGLRAVPVVCACLCWVYALCLCLCPRLRGLCFMFDSPWGWRVLGLYLV